MANYPDLNQKITHGAPSGGAYPPPQAGVQTATPLEDGAKDFGEPMPVAAERFVAPTGWRNLPWAILFLLTIVGVIGYGSYGVSQSKVNVSIHMEAGPMIVNILVFTIAAFSLSWLYLYMFRNHPRFVIVAGIIFAVAAQIALGVFFKIQESKIEGANFTGQMVACFLVAIIIAIWGYLVRSRIPFAAKMLSLSGSVVAQFPSMIYFNFAGIFLVLVWLFFALFSFLTSIHDVGSDASWIWFSLLIYFWIALGIMNIMSVTVNGSVASWYFFSGTANAVHNPTVGALKRATTTSLGSVALGSLVVAIIGMLRSMLRSMRRNRNPFLMCIAACLLALLEAVIQYITKYAFVYVAVYGKPFIESAKCTWQLLTQRGFDMIINDDLTEMALSFVALVIGISSGAVTYGLYKAADLDLATCEYSCVLAFEYSWLLVGLVFFYVCLVSKRVMSCAISTIFVCYAEDPAALAESKPQVAESLTTAFNSHYPTSRVTNGRGYA